MYTKCMKTKQKKTPKYLRKAVDKYRSKYDVISLRLPAGTVERMNNVGMTPKMRVEILLDTLERMEKDADSN